AVGKNGTQRIIGIAEADGNRPARVFAFSRARRVTVERVPSDKGTLIHTYFKKNGDRVPSLVNKAGLTTTDQSMVDYWQRAGSEKGRVTVYPPWFENGVGVTKDLPSTK